VRLAPVLALILAGCGARTQLEVPGPGGSPGTTGACAGTLTLAASITVDAPTSDSEPESAPVLAWTGSELLVAWTRWTPSQYSYVVDPVQVSTGGLAAGPVSTLDAPENNPFNLRATWDGSALALYWAQDDNSLVLQHVGADGTPIDAMPTTLVAATGAQTIPSGLVSVSGAYLLSWFVQTDAGWETMAAPFTHDGAPSGSPVLLYSGSDDYGTLLAPFAGSVFALWATHASADPTSPVTTTLASLDPATAAVGSTTSIDQGVDHDPGVLVADPARKRLDVATWLPDTNGALLLSGTAGGDFTTQATLDGATGSPLLAVDPCAGLVVLVPVGQMTTDNPLPTGATVQRVANDGTLGPAVTLPVGSSYLESYDLVPVAGGFAAAWVEGGSGSPGRSLHVAYVRAQ
jgi:hypothetical protein